MHGEARVQKRQVLIISVYYKQFDSDRSGLAPLYGEDSMLTFEAAPCQGVANIIQKLNVSHFSSATIANLC